jgi:predicted RND superfamily exporter protein
MTENRVKSFIERMIFDHRAVVLFLLTLLTIFLSYQALQVKPAAGFEKMIPLKHPYIMAYYGHRDDLPSGNIVQIAVEYSGDDIFDPDYLETLRSISDEAFLLPGVDRAEMKSLWTKNVQWRAVTEEGFEGGVVMPDQYDGSPQALGLVRANVMRSGQVGKLVANNFKSTIVQLPLLDVNPKTGEPLDYTELSRQLEQIREKYSSDTITVHIIGFAKLVGDLIAGIASVAGFFAIACLLTIVLLYAYLRCIPGTVLPITCSIIAVIWQLGLLNLLGFGLDPYSILVPFLVFAIGVSHGVQIVNAIAIESSRGHNKQQAARLAFGDLFSAGITALLSDAIGFVTLLLIEISVIQELGIGAALGVAAIIATNLVLLPVLMSYWGISRSGVKHAGHRENEIDIFASFLGKIVRPRAATVTVLLGLLFAVGGLYGTRFMQIGDLDKGAPELRPESMYNLDVDYIVSNYSTSSDIMVVMVESGEYQCVSYETLDLMDQLQWKLAHMPGVQSTDAATNGSKRMAVLLNEGNMKWYAVPRDQHAIFANVYSLPHGVYFNDDCNFGAIFIALDDHKAETLSRVTSLVEEFNREKGTEDVSFVLAAGNAGIAAATNQEIKRAQIIMLAAVYAVVTLMVYLTFRSLAAVVCIIVPLGITSLLAQALMAYLGIGVKVATLPVIALGVGIGVDYGIYIYNRIQEYLKEGLGLQHAYTNALKTTGKAVTFTGITLAIGVFTWVFSSIKFQADMGVLLTFMFLWNMLGALTLAPALGYFMFRKEDLQVAVPQTGSRTADIGD